jgi:hypothetical protein
MFVIFWSLNLALGLAAALIPRYVGESFENPDDDGSGHRDGSKRKKRVEQLKFFSALLLAYTVSNSLIFVIIHTGI